MDKSYEEYLIERRTDQRLIEKQKEALALTKQIMETDKQYISALEQQYAKAKADIPHFCSLCAHYNAELGERQCDVDSKGCQWEWRGEKDEVNYDEICSNNGK